MARKKAFCFEGLDPQAFVYIRDDAGNQIPQQNPNSLIMRSNLSVIPKTIDSEFGPFKIEITGSDCTQKQTTANTFSESLLEAEKTKTGSCGYVFDKEEKIIARVEVFF